MFGWGGRIRTYACWSQNPEPYRLATPQGNIIMQQNFYKCKCFLIVIILYVIFANFSNKSFENNGKNVKSLFLCINISNYKGNFMK